MASLAAIVVASSAGLAAAFPMFYEQRKNGCEIPQMTFGPHAAAGEISVDDTIAFQVMDSSGAMATTWTPGETYEVTISAYEGASPPAVNAWVHSSVGEFEEPSANCPNAALTTAPAPEHSFTWVAPADATECAVLSTAMATGSSDPYKTNTNEFCPENLTSGSAAAGPAPAGAPEAAPGPEGEGVEGGLSTPDTTGTDPTDPATGEASPEGPAASGGDSATGSNAYSIGGAVMAAGATFAAALVM